MASRAASAVLAAAIGSSALAQAVTSSVTTSVTTATTARMIEGLVCDESALTTGVRAEPSAELDLPRVLLDIPRGFTELLFMPLQPVLEVSEKYQLHERLFDLFTNDAKTFAAGPIVEFFSYSGIGFGGAMLYNSPLLSPDRFTAIVLARVNGDINASAVFSQRLPSMSGRTFKVEAGYYVDHDSHYYGFDPQNQKHLRLIKDEGVDAKLTLQLLNPGDSDFRFYVMGAYRHRTLSPGVPAGASTELPLTPGDGFTPPGGFGRSLDYPEASLKLELDSRDSGGRTTNGVVASVEAVFSRDVEGAGTGDLQGTSQVSVFVPVLPLHRVVFLQVGGRFAAPIGGQVPLHELVRLGGQHTLRGYDTDRFLGRLAWWGTAEYRYKVFEEKETTFGFAAALFFDVGQVGQDFDRLLMSPLRWSTGIGFRVDSSLFMVGRLQLGFSPEGFQVTVGIGELL